MWDPEDVQRSLRRCVTLALGSPPWSIRTQRVEVSDDDRPAALVEESAPWVTFQARATIPQGNVLEGASYAVVCYPELAATEPESEQRAGRCRNALRRLVLHGLVDDDAVIVPPLKVPIYDFADVTVDPEAPAAERAGPAEPYDYADVLTGWNVQRQQDPLDRNRWTVILNLRLRVDWPGRDINPAPIAGSMPLDPAPDVH